MLENIGFDTLIVWIRLRLHDLPSDQFRPLIVSSPSTIFPLTCYHSEPPWDALCDAFMSSSSLSCRPSLAMIRSSSLHLTCSDLSIIEPWWLHLNQYTSKVIDLYIRTNLNFLVVFFILMPPPNSIDLTSYSSSSRALESWTNTISFDTICCDEIDMLDTNYCVHNPWYHTYYDTNSWAIRDPHRRPQARHEIDSLEHTR